MPRVLLASHRLPVTLSVEAGSLVAAPSPGGLATALGALVRDGQGAWVGWPGAVGQAVAADVEAALAPFGAAPVLLSDEELRGSNEGFSNGVLWPLCHYLLDKVRLDAQADWQRYRAVNERFADALADRWRPGDLVWVHDYQLALVPALLRRRLPQARIGFFLHVPFPGPEVFRILPWRAEVLRGLVGADVIGFHTASYAYHFAYACSQLLGLELAGDVLQDDGRPVRVGAFPIGIDADGFVRRALRPDVRERAAALRAEAGGRTLLLSVDRFDYTKGLVRRLLAIERLLAARPELKDRLHFIQLAVPTREQVDGYAEYRRTVNELVGRLNGAFGSPTRNVVHLVHRSVDVDELTALYLAADVMLVTPLRDGMNLVAKEYVACRTEDDGVLVLSEFAGAATELHDALHVNPYDLEALAAAIRHAVELSADEQAQRMRALRRVVHAGSVSAWASSFLTALDESPVAPAALPTAALDVALERLATAPALVLLLDYDGTLVEFASSPGGASPDEALLDLLRALSARPGTSVHVVSGRSRESLEDFLGQLDLGLHAEHGLWSRPRRGDGWTARAPLPPPWLAPVRDVLRAFVRRTDGAFLEEKSGALAFHYRATEPQLAHRRVAELRHALVRHAQAGAFEVLEGVRVLEVRQRGVHKGVVVRDVLAANPSAAVLAVGDDRTDESLFAALPSGGIGVHVGSGDSLASYRLSGVEDVRHFLGRLVERRA